MRAKIIFSKERALKANDILILADLHLGFEYELLQKGISIPSQTKRILEKIKMLISEFNPEKLLFLGDVKHSIVSPSFYEKKELFNFFKELSETISEIIITKGNHDGDIEKYIPKNITLAPGAGVRIAKFGFAHGHAYISRELLKCKYLFLAHEHPAIEFKDRFGYKIVEPCWIISKPFKKRFEERFQAKCKIEKAIILPAFNHIIGGISFNSPDFKPLGVNTKLLNLREAEVYLTDGTKLGKLKNLI